MRFIALIFGALFAHQTLACDCQTDKPLIKIPGCESKPTVTGPAVIHTHPVRPATITTEISTEDAHHPRTRLCDVPATIVTRPIRIVGDSSQGNRRSSRDNRRGDSRDNRRGDSRDNRRGDSRDNRRGDSGENGRGRGQPRIRPRKVIKIDQNGCTGQIQTTRPPIGC